MPAFQPSRAARAADVFAGAAGVAALVGGLLAAPHDVAPVLAGALLVLGVAPAALWGYALYRPRRRTQRHIHDRASGTPWHFAGRGAAVALLSGTTGSLLIWTVFTLRTGDLDLDVLLALTAVGLGIGVFALPLGVAGGLVLYRAERAAALRAPVAPGLG